MNRTEFIGELQKRLKYIPAEDREDAIEYYTELMSDMGFDETQDVTEKLGSAKDAAKKILDECTQKHVEEYDKNKSIKGHATVVWLWILGALSLPLSLPLAIVVLALAISAIAIVVTVFITIAASSVALVCGGLVSFYAMFKAPSMAQGAVIFGMGLVLVSSGVLMGFGIFYLVRAIFRRIFRRDRQKIKEEDQQ